MIRQRTLKTSVSATGVGLHSGEPVRLTLRPAAVGHGIVFQRVDLPAPNRIAATPDAVNDTRMSSTLVDGPVRVGTIEHLMSAIAAVGLDNLLVQLDAPEVPIMDGSAMPFLFLMQEAGVAEQDAPKRFIRVKKTVEVHAGDKWVRLQPHAGFRIQLTIEFPHPAFARSPQSVSIDFAESSFIESVSRARTFGFMQEVEYMRENGLGLGGSLDNAIVLDELDVLNDSGLRYQDEFVRHKILDAIGDLYIVGAPLIAEFSGFKSGHALNNRLLRDMLADSEAFEYVTFATLAEVPPAFHGLDTLQPSAST